MNHTACLDLDSLGARLGVADLQIHSEGLAAAISYDDV